MDLIKELGPLALGSRLKRLSDRLMRDIARVYETQRVNFEPRWFAVAYLLDKEGPMNVTAIARALGMTHPAINQIAGAMAKAHLLTGAKGKTDERQRVLSLTPDGKAVVQKLIPVWEEIEVANRELLRLTGSDLLVTLTRMEKELDRTDMYQRVMHRIRSRQMAAVEVVGYQPKLKKHFRDLNLEWLKKYFDVEPVDEEILSDPAGKILKKGGQVLFARIDGRVVGTCALVRAGNGTFELTKMAVTESMQGRQIGRRLLQEAIDQARKAGAHEMVLYTSPKLTAACGLYRSFGFSEVPSESGEEPKYKRCTIQMHLNIDKGRKAKGRRNK